ncbi:MAG: gamma-glutamyltransferase [Bacteroidia bacterium]|nr:gamma-glutamyltransferase [Bacteroidia bacterium]
MNRQFSILFIFVLLACNSTGPYVKSKGMVSCAHPLAADVGVNILKQGGNAFDAAVAVQFALAVVYPRAGNIAAGGFAVYHTADGNVSALDFREKAPLAAHRDMFLDDMDSVIANKSLLGHLAVAVPGTVEGMWQLHQRLGVLSFSQLIQPAIDLANNGFELTQKEAETLNKYQEDFYAANDYAILYLKDEGWKEGDRIINKSLAKTLIRIRDYGADGFYKGKTAALMLDEMQRGGGIITQKDLNGYEVKWRKPIISSYKGHTVISMCPPSSGGIALMQLLKGYEMAATADFEHNSAEHIHLMTELERRVYADRASHLGDPEFYDVPVDLLLDSMYLVNRFSTIQMDKRSYSNKTKQGNLVPVESSETTHFSIVDKDRNAIALTTTLNGNYGSKVMVKGGGFFLNNQMDDFSVKPGSPNQFGLVGDKANEIAPEKRMLSSMTPTILEKNGELFLVLGTPGGSRIITSVFQTILNVIDFEMELQEAIDAKKVHHQWLPDTVYFEKDGLPQSVINNLLDMGHFMKARKPIGKVDAVMQTEDNTLIGAADKRGDDAALGY